MAQLKPVEVWRMTCSPVLSVQFDWAWIILQRTGKNIGIQMGKIGSQLELLF